MTEHCSHNKSITSNNIARESTCQDEQVCHAQTFEMPALYQKGKSEFVDFLMVALLGEPINAN